MIHGAVDNRPDNDIPLENIDEPIEFYTMAKTKSQSATGLLAPGTDVIVKNERHPQGDKGKISHVDTEDLNTIYPYFVTFGSSSGWCKVKDVQVIETPGETGNLATAIVGLLFIQALFIASCTGPKRPVTRPVIDTDSVILNNYTDTLHSEIPKHNG